MKEQLYQLLKEVCERFEFAQREEFTASWLAEQCAMSRNAASQYLNEGVEKGEIIKVNTRPVYFLMRLRYLRNAMLSWISLSMLHLKNLMRQ